MRRFVMSTCLMAVVSFTPSTDGGRSGEHSASRSSGQAGRSSIIDRRYSRHDRYESASADSHDFEMRDDSTGYPFISDKSGRGGNRHLSALGKTSRIDRPYEKDEESAFSAAQHPEIESFRHWDAGWDGDDAEAPSPLAIDMADFFVGLLPKHQPQPNAMVLDHGTVAVFWRNSEGRYLEVGFNSSGKLYWYAKLAAGNKFHGDDESLGNSRVVDYLISLVDQVMV